MSSKRAEEEQYQSIREMRKAPLILAALLILVILVIGSSGCEEARRDISGILPYHTESFTISPLSGESLSLELSSGDSLEGYVQVTIGGTLDIKFEVKDPYGKIIHRAPGGVKGRHDFMFYAQHDGYYTLLFDNSFSLLTSKSVIVKYRRT